MTRTISSRKSSCLANCSPLHHSTCTVSRLFLYSLSKELMFVRSCLYLASAAAGKWKTRSLASQHFPTRVWSTSHHGFVSVCHDFLGVLTTNDAHRRVVANRAHAYSVWRAYGAPNVTKIRARRYGLYPVILRHGPRNITRSALRRRMIVTPSYCGV